MTQTTYLGREIVKQETIKVEGTFQSYYEACRKLQQMGYTIGSMCGDEPIGFADAEEYEYIAKWRNIAPSDRKLVDGVIISNDWREGSVDIIWFVEPKEELITQD